MEKVRFINGRSASFGDPAEHREQQEIAFGLALPKGERVLQAGRKGRVGFAWGLGMTLPGMI